MKMSRFEKILVNNALRAFAQRRFEAREFERLGGRSERARVLEVGCGRGVGVEILLDRFGAAEVDAFDLDPEMVALARSRLSRRLDGRVRLFVADATRIPCPSAFYDAVFDFGAIHHVPDWQQAVGEIARVLAPGGRFYFHEFTRKALQSWFHRTFTDHPKENRFDPAEFIEELARCGILVGGNFRVRFFEHMILGVGHRIAGTGLPSRP